MAKDKKKKDPDGKKAKKVSCIRFSPVWPVLT